MRTSPRLIFAFCLAILAANAPAQEQGQPPVPAIGKAALRVLPLLDKREASKPVTLAIGGRALPTKFPIGSPSAKGYFAPGSTSVKAKVGEEETKPAKVDLRIGTLHVLVVTRLPESKAPVLLPVSYESPVVAGPKGGQPGDDQDDQEQDDQEQDNGGNGVPAQVRFLDLRTDRSQPLFLDGQKIAFGERERLSPLRKLSTGTEPEVWPTAAGRPQEQESAAPDNPGAGEQDPAEDKAPEGDAAAAGKTAAEEADEDPQPLARLDVSDRFLFLVVIRDGESTEKPAFRTFSFGS